MLAHAGDGDGGVAVAGGQPRRLSRSLTSPRDMQPQHVPSSCTNVPVLWWWRRIRTQTAARLVGAHARSRTRARATTDATISATIHATTRNQITILSFSMFSDCQCKIRFLRQT